MTFYITDFESNVTQDSGSPFISEIRSQPDHNMSEQRQKKLPFFSPLSSRFRDLRSRPPLPNNEIQAELQCTASSLPGASTPPKSLAGSSTILHRINDSQTVNESDNQQHTQR